MKNTSCWATLGLLFALAASAARAQAPTPALAATALAVGTPAPMFKAKVASGCEVDLKQLLKKGPWCFISTGGSGAPTATSS